MNERNSIYGCLVSAPEDQDKWIKRSDGSKELLRIPEQDPFWPAFFNGLS